MNKDKHIIIEGKRYYGSATLLTDDQAKENRLLMILKGTDHFDYSDYEKEVFTHESYEDIVKDGSSNMQSYVTIKDFRPLYTNEEINKDKEAFLKTQLERIREDNSFIYLIDGEEQLKKALLLLLAKPSTKSFNLIRQRLHENKTWVDSFKYDDKITDPETALRSAVADFLTTDDGEKATKDTCNDFNWGDVLSYVPESFLNKHGIYTVYGSNIIDIVVDQDEVLCD